MTTIFCPKCNALILDTPTCPSCGWQRPVVSGDTGDVIWRTELGHVLPKPRASAVVVGGRCCLSAEDGTIVALDLETGQLAWERQIDTEYDTHALATDGTRLFVSSVDTRPLPINGKALLALDAETGADLWQYPTAGHSLSAAALANGVVYFSSSDGVLHAVDAASGQARWQVRHASWGPEAPVADANFVYVGGRGDALGAYAIGDGAEQWRFSGTAWFASPLCLVEGQLYALNWDGFLYVFEAHTGELVWKVKGQRGQGFTSPPASNSSQVYVGSRVYRESDGAQVDTYALLALRKEDGGEVWRFLTPKHIVAPPSGASNSVFFGAEDGFFYALNAETGEERWKVELNGRIVTQPLIAGDLAYVGERHGTVYALRWRARPAEQAQPADFYLRQGEYEQAAIAHALSGDFAAAAGIYEQPLRQPREAALLYECAGQPARSARLWEAIGELRRARDLYQTAGDRAGVARMLEALGESLQAAKLYEEIGELATAAPLYEQAGDRVKAADLYYSNGQIERASQIWQSLGEWERLVSALIEDQQFVAAAELLAQHQQSERAAELYEQADQVGHAMELRVALGHWERVIDLAACAGSPLNEGIAHEHLGNTLAAAQAYERAAQQVLAAEPTAEERAATFYEQAARLYDLALADEDLARCRQREKQLRRLPDIAVSGAAQTSFVEFEWNTLNLLVENTGYGPATQIAITFQGAFDIEGNRRVVRLAPNKITPIEIYVRPQHDYYGSKVPLEITVTYQDRAGTQYVLTQHIPLRVLQKGSTAEQQTPLEIDIRSSTRLEHQEVNPVKSTDEEIEQQQSLLNTHRRTVAHLVGQAAQYGGEAFAPPQVANGLYEARENIRRTKRVLHDWGLDVADHPNDLDTD